MGNVYSFRNRWERQNINIEQNKHKPGCYSYEILKEQEQLTKDFSWKNKWVTIMLFYVALESVVSLTVKKAQFHIGNSMDEP